MRDTNNIVLDPCSIDLLLVGAVGGRWSEAHITIVLVLNLQVNTFWPSSRMLEISPCIRSGCENVFKQLRDLVRK